MITGIITTVFRKKVPSVLKISRLNIMLWGGVAMLVVDNILAGEIVLYPPFLTAMENPAALSTVVQEIITVGGMMTLVVVIFWAILVAVTAKMTQHSK